jgi:MscS family membrane protein
MMIPAVMGLFFALEYLQLDGLFGVLGSKVVRSWIVVIIFWIFLIWSNRSFLLNKIEAYSRGHARLAAEGDQGSWWSSSGRPRCWRYGASGSGPSSRFGAFRRRRGPGAQDLFKNLISGLLIISEKRFGIGDWIQVEGVVEGTVEAIGIRSTIVGASTSAVYVPMQTRRHLGHQFQRHDPPADFLAHRVEYRTTTEQLRRIRDGIEAISWRTNPLPDRRRCRPLSGWTALDSSIDIMLYCFTRSTVWGQWLAIKEQLALKVKEIVEGAGSSFAFPSRSLYMTGLAGERPEMYVPPAGRRPSVSPADSGSSAGERVVGRKPAESGVALPNGGARAGIKNPGPPGPGFRWGSFLLERLHVFRAGPWALLDFEVTAVLR